MKSKRCIYERYIFARTPLNLYIKKYPVSKYHHYSLGGYLHVVELSSITTVTELNPNTAEKIQMHRDMGHKVPGSTITKPLNTFSASLMLL